MAKKEKIGLWLIFMITLGAVAVLFMQEPIPQSLSYHSFADQRAIWGIPNFFNVISNLPFLLVGLLGLYETSLNNKITIAGGNGLSYKVFFTGMALIGIGSGYYHLWPDNETLVWDRIPMTMAFAALFCIVTGEFLSMRLGSILLIPLVLIGVSSVLYWYYSEITGHGDLRLYILIQFLPMLLIPVILICFDSLFTKVGAYWLLLLAYVIAKFLEHYDFEILDALGGLSGHSLKHVVAAMGVYILLISFCRRSST